jgi:hypothetical protein
MFGEHVGMVVPSASAVAAGNLLEADDVRLFVLDDLDDPLEAVAPVPRPPMPLWML